MLIIAVATIINQITKIVNNFNNFNSLHLCLVIYFIAAKVNKLIMEMALKQAIVIKIIISFNNIIRLNIVMEEEEEECIISARLLVFVATFS